MEDLARSRKAAAAAEEEETLANLRLEAIELEAEEKRIACGSEAGSVVSGRSRRSVCSASSVVSFKSSLIKNAEFKRSAEPTHGTEAGSKPNVGAITRGNGATLKMSGDGATAKVKRTST